MNMNRPGITLTYRLSLILLLVLMLVAIFIFPVSAEPLQIPDINLQIGDGTGDNPQNLSTALQLVILLTVLALAPAILIMVTSFIRIIVVMGFIRTSLATQQMPPNQVLIGLALFLTFFVMAPTFQQVNNQALQPYLKGEINQEIAFKGDAAHTGIYVQADSGKGFGPFRKNVGDETTA